MSLALTTRPRVFSQFRYITLICVVTFYNNTDVAFGFLTFFWPQSSTAFYSFLSLEEKIVEGKDRKVGINFFLGIQRIILIIREYEKTLPNELIFKVYLIIDVIFYTVSVSFKCSYEKWF